MIKSWGVLIIILQVAWIVSGSPCLAQGISKSPIVIHGDKDYPPYESLVDGKPVGMNVDLWREISKVLDRSIEYRLYQWADSQARVKRGEGKVLSFMSFNKERGELYDFSVPTFSFNYPVFVPADRVDSFNVSNLSGKRIAVKKGGFPSTILKAFHPGAEIVFVDSPLVGFRKLLRNEVDGVVEDEIVGYTILLQNEFHSIKATSEGLASKTGHVAVVKGNPELVHQINEAIKIIKESGKFDQIADKWAGLDIVLIKKETIWLVLIVALMVLALIVSVGGIIYSFTVRKINVSLNKEIEDRKQTELLLMKSISDAETANQAKSQFLANMSHELRTPLNAVIGFSDTMKEGTFGAVNEKYLEYACDINSSGKHLLVLVNDILDLAKLENETVELDIEKTLPKEIIGEIIPFISEMMNDRNIEFVDLCDGHENVVVLADRTKLKQVLLNLFTNAIKYNNEGGRIILSCEGVADRMTRITIEDTGLGIPLSSQPHLFEAFNRLGYDDTNIKGTGIGLTISKHLMEYMDGRIGFESTEGQGSKFWVEIPYAV